MCGIAGFIFKNSKDIEEKKKIIKNILIELSERGKDATGISLINSTNNNIRIFKLPLKAVEFVSNKKFIKFLDDYIKESNIVLLHCRARTQGDEKNNFNNHPLYSKETNSVLVHNGIIKNDEELKKKYNLKCDGEVDSEIILRLSEKVKKINKLYEELEGGFSFALYRGGKLLIFRYNNPLYLTYIKELDIIGFCSTREIFKNSLSESTFYIDGLFREKKFKYSCLTREVKNSSYFIFKFNGLDYAITEENAYLHDKTKTKEWDWSKKEKENTEYLKALIKDGEEYEGEFNIEELNEDEKRGGWYKVGGIKYCSDCDYELNSCMCWKGYNLRGWGF